MLYGLLLTLFVINCFLLALIIMVQKTKSSTGMGGIGSNVQMLFGGSGGQDLFQKITWFMGAVFMGGSLMLAIMKTRQAESSRYLGRIAASTQQMPLRAAKPSTEVPSSENK